MKKVLTYSDFLNESDNELKHKPLPFTENPLGKYTDLLTKHDWYYQMSDDDRAYDRGMAEKQAIKKAYAGLSFEDKKVAYDFWKAVYKKHYPKGKIDTKLEDFSGI